jgi:outer membrane protein OmpA-like peptidoglycan-associated protein
VAGARGAGVSRKPLYRRRRPWPALVLFVILSVVAGYVWVKVIHTSDDIDAAVRCNPPGAAPTAGAQPAPNPGQALAHDALDKTTPVAASQAQLRVFNASKQLNQASIVATAFAQYGFTKAAEPSNDALYPAGDMSCRGQIRFGPNGASAARTLSIIEPCAELVRDDRQDTTVDYAVGKRFDQVKVNPDAKQVLDELATWAQKQPPRQGGQLAQPAAQPPVGADLIDAARNVHC